MKNGVMITMVMAAEMLVVMLTRMPVESHRAKHQRRRHAVHSVSPPTMTMMTLSNPPVPSANNPTTANTVEQRVKYANENAVSNAPWDAKDAAAVYSATIAVLGGHHLCRPLHQDVGLVFVNIVRRWHCSSQGMIKGPRRRRVERLRQRKLALEEREIQPRPEEEQHLLLCRQDDG